MQRSTNPSLSNVFTGHDRDDDQTDGAPDPKRHQGEGLTKSVHAPQGQHMDVDDETTMGFRPKRKGKGVNKLKRKAAKPAICTGVNPLDFTTAMRDARLEVTIGQLMSMDKLPRAAIGKAFRSPRRSNKGKATSTVNLAGEGVSPTALVTRATVGKVAVPLILDSGSSLNIVSASVMRRLCLKPTRKADKPVTGVHGTRQMPAGAYDGLPITIEGVTIPADVVIIETEAYALIVGNEWLTKTKANINWGSMTVELKWAGSRLTVPVQCWTQVVDENESDSDDDSNSDDDEDSDDDADAGFASDLCSVSLTDQTVKWLERTYPRLYEDYLFLRDQQVRHPKVLPSYGTYGPGCRCRCGYELGKPTEICHLCQEDDQVMATLEVLPLKELEDVKPQVNKESLTPQQQETLDKLLDDNNDLFFPEGSTLPQTPVVFHHINTGDATPLKQRALRASQVEQQFIEAEIRRLLNDNMIKPSQSPWASPVVVVMKKNGKQRLCVDYRRLNAVTKKDSYPLPRIDDIFDSLTDAKWFSSLDLASGYWQVGMATADREKTAFVTKFGTFEFNVMPFGLTNAPATFQRLMDVMMHDAIGKFVLVYLDDINVYSKTFEEHLEHLQWVFDRLRLANLGCRPEKCEFVRQKLKFLGHEISAEGLSPDPDKVDKIKNCPMPKNVTQLRSFLGLASYYRKFVKDFSKKAAPLYELTRKDALFAWKQPQEAAFRFLQNELVSAPILMYPRFDRPFILHTDASNVGLGAVLAQKNDQGNEHVIAYASRTLNSAEVNYSTTERECLAAVWATKHFRVYLHGQQFDLVTDHNALKWLLNSSAPQGRTARWVMQLQEFSPRIVYRKGAEHTNADALSRLPPPATFLSLVF